MELPFNFREKAIGADFIGREVESNTLFNLLKGGDNVVIYSPDGTGKKSLINKVLIDLKKSSLDTIICEVNLYNVRTQKDFMKVFADSVILSGLSALEDLNVPADEKAPEYDLSEIIMMPQTLATKKNTNVIMYFTEFQNVLHFDDPDAMLKQMERCVSEYKNVTCLISGSKLNAMKYIFEVKKYFYGLMEYLPILPINEKVATDYIIRTFLRVGRVIDKEHVKIFYDISGGIPYYLWLLSSFSFNMTKGYVTPDIREQSISLALSLRESNFKGIIDSLSNFQLNLLRAIFDGVKKFSNKDVIDRYELNSSANVFRLKEALKKKEVIYFDDKDEPHFVDPMFKYWLSKCYFV